jgi:hypothetical protein
MYRSILSLALVAGPLGLAGCVESPPPTQVIVEPSATQQSQVDPSQLASPAPPPPAHSELVPPPPQGASNVAWQPGHWRYTGQIANPWVWQQGVYVQVPPGQTVWTPGRWVNRPGTGWVWVEGHWA